MRKVFASIVLGVGGVSLLGQPASAGPLFTGNPYTESRGADTLLGTREAGTADALNGKIYLFGGDLGHDALTDQIQVYDIATDTWRFANSTMPYAYKGNGEGGVVWGGKIYLSPGGGPGGWGSHSRIVEFDPVTETAVEKASFGADTWAASPAAIGNYIYWMGAAGFGQEDKIWKYDPLTDTLTHVADMAGISRNTSASAGSDGRAYAFGGQYMGTERTDIDIYDPVTNIDVLSPTSLPYGSSPMVWTGPDDLIYMMRPNGGGYGIPLWAYQTGTDIFEASAYTYSFSDFDGMTQSYDPATGKVYFLSGNLHTSWEDTIRGTYILTPVSVIPAPGAIALGLMGMSLVGWLRGRRTL